ncbi:hypothetical protein QJQ45_015656, partial [Haematococcus lacustris]
SPPPPELRLCAVLCCAVLCCAVLLAAGTLLVEVSVVTFLLQGYLTTGLKAVLRTLYVAGAVAGLDSLVQAAVALAAGIRLAEPGICWRETSGPSPPRPAPLTPALMPSRPAMTPDPAPLSPPPQALPAPDPPSPTLIPALSPTAALPIPPAPFKRYLLAASTSLAEAASLEDSTPCQDLASTGSHPGPQRRQQRQQQQQQQQQQPWPRVRGYPPCEKVRGSSVHVGPCTVGPGGPGSQSSYLGNLSQSSSNNNGGSSSNSSSSGERAARGSGITNGKGRLGAAGCMTDGYNHGVALPEASKLAWQLPGSNKLSHAAAVLSQQLAGAGMALAALPALSIAATQRHEQQLLDYTPCNLPQLPPSRAPDNFQTWRSGGDAGLSDGWGQATAAYALPTVASRQEAYECDAGWHTWGFLMGHKLFLVVVYAILLVLPYTSFRDLLPAKRATKLCAALLFLNLFAALGAVLAGCGVRFGYCVWSLAIWAYRTSLAPLLYASILWDCVHGTGSDGSDGLHSGLLMWWEMRDAGVFDYPDPL